MSHSLQTYLSVDKETNNPLWIVSALPDGWRNKFQEVILGLDELVKVELSGIAIKDGVLYIRYAVNKEKDVQWLQKSLLAEYVTKTLLQQSAQTCMVCGQYARRRKEQAHKPALCRKHYLEYINALEE